MTVDSAVLLRLLMVGQSQYLRGTCAEDPEPHGCGDTPAEPLLTQSTGGWERFGEHTGGRREEPGEHPPCSHLQGRGEAGNNLSSVTTSSSAPTAPVVCLYRTGLFLTNYCSPSIN